MNRIPNWVYKFVVALVAILIFHLKFDLRIVWFSYDQWLMTVGSDWAPNYLQWCFYRITPWQWPIGLIENYSYPEPVSVGLTGAIPIFALLFKPFEALFNEHFQYHGLYLLTNYILQGLTAYALLSLKIKEPLVKVLGSIFFILSSVFLFRFYHVNLTCHWIILYLIYIYYQDQLTPRAIFIRLTLLSVLAALIQAYVILFPFGLGIAIWFKKVRQKQVKPLTASMFILAIPATIMAAWAVLGNFVIGLSGGQGKGFGHYSANANTLFNHQGFGSILPELPVATNGQYEGLGYLGIGIFILLLAKILFQISNKIKVQWRQDREIWVMALLFFIFSLSNVISFNGWSTTIPLPEFMESLFSRFRSSGRYIWVIHYLIIFTSISWIKNIRRSNKWLAVSILSIAIFFQVLDLRPMLKSESFKHQSYTPRLDIEAFDPIANKAELVVAYPPYLYEYVQPADAEDLIYMAYRHKKPISAGHLARPGTKHRWAFTNAFNAYRNGEADSRFDNALIITGNQYFWDFEHLLNSGFTYFQIDGYLVLFPQKWQKEISILTNQGLIERDPLSTETLVQFLEKYSNNTVFVTGKDESTEGLCQEAKTYLTSRGSNIDSLAFRGSYAAILHKDSVIWESIENEKMIRQRFEKSSNIANLTFKKPVEIIAAGNKLGKQAHIWIGPNQYSENWRGLNMVAVDNNFDVLESVNFDTWLRCHRILE